MKKILLIYSFIFNLSSYASGYLPPVGGQATAMGGCGLLGNNVFSATNNQALMPWLKKAGIGFSFQNYYHIKNLNQLNFTAVVPLKNVAYGFNLFSFGNGAYMQQSIGASVGYSLNKLVSIGLGADYHAITIANYGSNNAITIQGGMATKVNEKLQVAFHVFNPLRAKFNTYKDERLTSTYKFGINYIINSQLNTLIEVEKNNLYKANFKTGLNYAIKEKFNLRIGLNTSLPQVSFGIGYQYKKLTIETASIIHQYLGVSHHFSFLFSFGK